MCVCVCVRGREGEVGRRERQKEMGRREERGRQEVMIENQDSNIIYIHVM